MMKKLLLFAVLSVAPVFAEDGDRLFTVDHYVRVKSSVPTLLIAGVHDKQVNPDRVREFYTDPGARQKVFIDFACSSHNAMWEKNHILLFRASLEWLTRSSVNGSQEGMLRLGY